MIQHQYWGCWYFKIDLPIPCRGCDFSKVMSSCLLNWLQIEEIVQRLERRSCCKCVETVMACQQSVCESAVPYLLVWRVLRFLWQWACLAAVRLLFLSGFFTPGLTQGTQPMDKWNKHSLCLATLSSVAGRSLITKQPEEGPSWTTGQADILPHRQGHREGGGKPWNTET